MGKFKENVISECVEIIKRDDVKKEIKALFNPIIDLILKEIYPYIFLSMIFVLISFLLILGIFILLLRNNKPAIKIPYFLSFS
mgnify:CR=1 FL=1|jgi:hypothetical protein|tara:strand:+ start:24782 stop:25030 length:249 start_codon:yes stop_codon:yes gene_type:complete